MQFVPLLAQLLQRVWGDYPKEVPIWISKGDISNACHWFHLRPSDVGKFAYVVHPVPSDASCILCIDLVLPMGWFDSPDFF